MGTPRLLWFVIGGTLACSLLVLKFVPEPYVWMGLLWCLAGLLFVAIARRTAVRLVCLAGAGTALAVGAAEAALWIVGLPAAGLTRESTPYPMQRDSVLGWRLTPNLVTRAVARSSDTTIYDVTYTTDSLGHRIAPPDSGPRARGCVWFVVCSFTFGEGVPDNATLPYRVGMRTGGKFRVVNLGAPGYGAEHILVSLERGVGLIRPPCDPTHIVYQALPHHVARAAGQTEFSRYGPRYSLGPDGTPVYLGTPPRPAPAAEGGVGSRLAWQMSKSRLFRLIRDRPREGSLTDLPLYLAIVRRVQDLVTARYPDAELHLLTWGTPGNHFDVAFQDSVAAIGPNVHRVEDILPDFATSSRDYTILRDGHPNPRAYDLLARFVAESILGVPQLETVVRRP